VFRRGQKQHRSHDAWVLLSLIPLAGSLVPLIIGLRYNVRSWIVAGAVWPAASLVGLVLAAHGSHGAQSQSPAGGLLILLGWLGGIVAAILVRARKRRRPDLAALDVPGADGLTAAAYSPPRHRDRWPWVSVAPFGLGAWAPVIAGMRCRRPWWVIAGVAGIALCCAGFVTSGTARSHGVTNQTQAAIGGLLIILAWISGMGISFGIRSAYDAACGYQVSRPPWPSPTERSRSWSARYALCAYAATFAATLLLALLINNVLNVNVQVGVGVLIVDAILLLGLVPLARRRGLSPADLGFKRTLPVRSLPLVFLALGLYFVLAALWALAFIGSSTTHTADVLSQAKHAATLDVVITVVAASASAPIVEETFFRGLLYRSLRNRLPILPAALVSGALFGLVHITGYPLITLPVKALFGVFACLLYERTGSLLPGIALHSFVDASATDVSLTGNDWVVLIVAGALILAILVRASWVRLSGGPAGLPPPAGAVP